MTRQLVNRSLAALLMVGLTASCDALDSLSTFDCHGTVQHQTTLECDNSGGAQLMSPTFPLPANIEGARPCAEAPATCVAFTTSQASNYFQMKINLGNIPEGTYSLRGGDGVTPDVSGTISTAGGPGAPLVARVGTLVVTERDGQHIAGTFAVHVASEDGQHDMVLSNGVFDIGGDCRTRDRASCVPNPNGSY